MIQMQTNLDVADNSGARRVMNGDGEEGGGKIARWAMKLCGHFVHFSSYFCGDASPKCGGVQEPEISL